MADLGVSVARVHPAAGNVRDRSSTWDPHPLLAFGVRTVAVATPIAAALAVTVLVTQIIPAPHDLSARVVWWIGMALVASVVAAGVDRVARRLMPLSALLKLTLVFPDRAPSRMSIALRTGTTRQLAERVARMREAGTTSSELLGATELLSLVAALNAHDRLTRGHSERVRALADLLAAEIGLDDDARNKVRWAALLHDIGKLTVPAAILNKRGMPTAAEWDVIHTHPAAGAAMIEGPLAEWLGEWADGVGDHHEKWDGTGYPRGLAGNEISLAGRLVAVVDAFEVMTSLRSYKKPLSPHQARAELTRCAGSHFDPALVRAFLGISIGRLRLAMGPLMWLAQVPLLARAPIATVAPAPAATGGLSIATGLAAITAMTATVLPAAIDRSENVSGAIPQASTTTSPLAFAAPASTWFVGVPTTVFVGGGGGGGGGGAGAQQPGHVSTVVVVPADETFPSTTEGSTSTIVIDSSIAVLVPATDLTTTTEVPAGATTSSVAPTSTLVATSAPAPKQTTTAGQTAATTAPTTAAGPTTTAASTTSASSSTTSASTTAVPTGGAPTSTPASTTVAPASSSPGNSGSAPGQNKTPTESSAPGNSGSAPGHGPNGPGNSENAPGHTSTTTTPAPTTTSAPTANAPTPDTCAPLTDKERKDLDKDLKRAEKDADKAAKDLADAQKDLDKAKQKGDADAIAKATTKLADAQAAVDALTSTITTLTFRLSC